MSIKYFKKNEKTRKYHFLKVFLSDLKTFSIQSKIETISPLTMYGKDSKPAGSFEWAWDGQWDCLVDPPDGGTALDAVYSSIFFLTLGLQTHTIHVTSLVQDGQNVFGFLLQKGKMHCHWKGPVTPAVLKIILWRSGINIYVVWNAVVVRNINLNVL